jgi:5-methyltetrahydrofolate--homocysteine methyltransferase
MQDIRDRLNQQILILDGAMGTFIQSLGIPGDAFHRGRFADWKVSLTGNNDVLNLTAPEVIADIHQRYIEAGADIITTNTFSSNKLSQQEYDCQDIAREMAYEGARIARQVADQSLTSHPSPLTSHPSPLTSHPSPLTSHLSPLTSKKIWVAGSMGPTSKSLTLASNMNEPAQRTVDFDTMAAAYGEQAEALIAGGADLLLLETCFDALNTKAALYAIQQLNERLGRTLPVMVSATINDRSGRTLTGQTLEAFYVSIAHYPILSFGLNCSFGVEELRPFIQQLAARVPAYISIHPNAGLPNEMGEYEELPEFTARHLRQMAEAGLLNIAGGCCGTDDNHIRAISKALKGVAPRRLPQADPQMWVAGLEPLLVDRQTQNFVNVGERTNVAGSRKFARLIAEKKYDEAMTVARQQIDGGAAIIDINMDDAMLDSRHEMQTFCRYIANDPGVGRAVLMIDSSDWPTILAGLKNSQGKCIVNSISLKGGEADFLSKARELRRLGAAVVVMAFDEEGQATTYERKTAIAQRAYNLLTTVGFPPQDIIFDVNILSIGTGISDHANYGVDFIRAVAWIKQNLPHVKTSGGVSNLSFAFRGNNKVREAMHSVFLYHAIRAGLDMAIVNPSMLQVYDDIEPSLLKAVEDVILNTDAGATDRLIALAADLQREAAVPGDAVASSSAQPSWRTTSIEERLSYALSKGVTDYLSDDIPEALQVYGGQPVSVIEGPLMQAMEHVGQLFGEGKMFLPQVVKSAKVMKDAVALLQPYMDEAVSSSKFQVSGSKIQDSACHQRPVIVTATANGDVHDIGKNIVDIVLGCNNFDVHDLGVMVPNETILAETQRVKPVMVGISGLITPSLKEMENLCRLFQQHGLTTPIVVGGATTSAVHTAVKLAPLYEGGVIYGGDASQTSVLAKKLQLDAEETLRQVRAEQQQLREVYDEHHSEVTPYAEANANAEPLATAPDGSAASQPSLADLTAAVPPIDIPIADVTDYIDWRMFLLFWGFKGETLQQLLVNPEAERTLQEGRTWLRQSMADGTLTLQAVVRFEHATRRGNDIVLPDGQLLPMLRSQSRSGHYRSLADYFDEHHPSPLGLFTIVARHQDDGSQPADSHLMSHAICARLAEACAEWLQQRLYGQQRAIRAAFGYASCPDHSLKRIVFDRLDAERLLDITLTDHYSIQPSTAICGLFIGHAEARYFPVGRIDREQLTDYCRRRGITLDKGESILSKYLT